MVCLKFRLVKFYTLLVVIGALLLARLVYLQLMEGPKLAVEGLNSRIQEIAVEVTRGEILDRKGNALTNTSQYYLIAVFPSQITNIDETIAFLGKYESEDVAKLRAAIIDGRPFKLKVGVDALTAQKINARKMPGVIAIVERVRYGYSSLGSHVVGYINSSDNRGVSGIEYLYDDVLRGSQPTYLAAMVDAGQQIIPGLGYKKLRLDVGQEPSNVVLTIDGRTQRICEQVMDKYIEKGAVIVLQPATGEILAMASRPNFDANDIGDYLGRGSSPLLNRAIAAYQPGSVFKLVVAAAAMEEKIVKPDDEFFDRGYIEIGGLRFKGWDYDKGGRGLISFREALAYSSNPVFIEVGQKLGADKLIAYARRLGFGEKTELNFVGEVAGNLPASGDIYAGDLANLSIGQGSLEVTPLQIACLVATIANDGIKVSPHIVSRITTSEGSTIKYFPPVTGVRVLSHQTDSQLRGMMTAVTQIGTGQAAYVENGGSAGKTGTAETGRFNAGGKGVNHAWFAGYYPLDNPQLVVVVFVEDGMSGADIAAPIFHEIVTRLISSDAPGQ